MYKLSIELLFLFDTYLREELQNHMEGIWFPHWLSGKESACQCFPMQKTQIQSLGRDREDPLEKDMAIHSSILAWKTHG